MTLRSNSGSYSATNPDPVTTAAKGRRTPIAALFRRAEVEPDKLFGSFPLTDNIEDGFRDFTFAELAKAVDVCAWHVKETFGTSDNFESILYMGVNDYRYVIIFYAAIKCGFQALFINPRYPIEGIMSVIEKTNCSKAFYSPEELPVIQSVQSFRQGVEAFELAQTAHWLSAPPHPFPFQKPCSASSHDPVLTVHSSGTTGPPKPITFRNGWFSTLDVPWPIPEGRRSTATIAGVEGCHLAFSVFPQAHAAGLCMNNIRPVFSGCASVMMPAAVDYTRSAEVTLQMLKVRPQIDTISATPALLETLCQMPGGVEALSGLKSILYSGGPLRPHVAEVMNRSAIFMLNVYGSIEMSLISAVSVDPEDYEYFHFNPSYKAIFEPIEDEAGSYELVLRKGEGKEEEELHMKRGIYWTLGVDEHRSRDLFLPHPTKSGIWKYYGRKDDILVLGSGGKFNPIPLEDMICSHPRVSGAMVAGEHRYPPCVLIEPAEKVDGGRFVKEVWPQIEKANATVRKDLRIPRDMVVVLEAGGLVRGIKGQVVRKMNAEKYAELIDGLYARSGELKN